MGDWSQLIPDLLVEIARRIPLVEDFTAFRGVCTSWRATVTNKNFVKSWPTIPLLMLAEKEDSDNREFCSLSKCKIWRTMSLPEAKGKKCIETRGWLLTEGSSGELGLVHPFSRIQIDLPHQTTFPEYEDIEMDPPYFISRAVLSADPSDTSDFILAVIHGSPGMLGIWRPGDRCWTRIETLYQNQRSFLSDIEFNNGKIYAINFIGRIWVWDVSRPDDTVAQFLLSIDFQLVACRVSYLVGSSNALLIVTREGSDVRSVGDTDTYGVIDFRVIQLDLIKGKWEHITSLGEETIFVGHNGAFSLDTTSFPGVIKPNCIYFTDDAVYTYTQTQLGGGKDMGVYYLQDGKIELFDDFQSFSKICPPIWVAPSL